MKKFAATVLASLFAASAFAATAYMDAVSKQVSWFRPDRAVDPVTEQEFANPSDGTLVACGFVLVEYEDCDFKYRLWGWEPSPWCRAMTQEERDAYDAEAASAETNAAYLATLPVQEPRGFEVPYVVFLDATNRTKGIAMEIMETGDQIFYVFHSSPVDWEKVDSNRKAAIAQARARRAGVEGAKAKGANANSVPALREAFSNLCVEINRPWIIPGM